MNNQTFMSPKQMQEQARAKLREAWAKGEWPPEGHPWKALLNRPKVEVVALFQCPEWVAVLSGLRQQRDDAQKVANNTSKPQALRDEAVGVVNMCNVMLELEETVKAFYKGVE